MDKEILDILELAMKIQLETDMCVFIDMFGHVNKLSIRTGKSKSKWSEDEKRFECGFGKDNIQSKRRQSIIKALQLMLKTQKFRLTRYVCKNNKCIQYGRGSFYFLNCSKAREISSVISCPCRLKK